MVRSATSTVPARTAVPDGGGSGPGPGSRARPLGHLSDGGEDVRGLVQLLGAVAAQPAFGRHPELGQEPAASSVLTDSTLPAACICGTPDHLAR
jgi:hypothetical protein